MLLTTSGTHALEMAALLLDIQPGDEDVMPSYTFVSTVNAFVLRGAKPVFCEIQEDDFNMDPAHVESLVSPKIRVIVPVHFAGVGCEMERILEIAKRYNSPVYDEEAAPFGDLFNQFLCGHDAGIPIFQERFLRGRKLLCADLLDCCTRRGCRKSGVRGKQGSH